MQLKADNEYLKLKTENLKERNSDLEKKLEASDGMRRNALVEAGVRLYPGMRDALDFEVEKSLAMLRKARCAGLAATGSLFSRPK